MIKDFIILCKNLDSKTLKILKNGFMFSFIVCIISIIVLFTYTFIFSTPIIYHSGLLLFQVSLSFAVEFVICAIVVDSIKKQII